MMAAQTVFSHLVSTLLPTAIPSQPSHIEGFGLGRAFIFAKKPKKFRPWSKSDLKFTGCSLSSLLTKESLDSLIITAATNLQLETSVGSEIRIKANLSSNARMKQAFEELGLKSTNDTLQGSIEAEFGKVLHVDTDVLFQCERKDLYVKMDHPTIQQAVQNGGTLFVSASIYEAERCSVKVSLDNQNKEVVNSPGITTIAYLLVKLSIAPNGLLRPVENTGIFSKLQGTTLPSVQATPIDQRVHRSETVSSYLIRLPERRSSRVKMKQDGWIVVDRIKAKMKKRSSKKKDSAAVPLLQPPELVEEPAIVPVVSKKEHPRRKPPPLAKETVTVDVHKVSKQDNPPVPVAGTAALTISNEQGHPTEKPSDSAKPKVVEKAMEQESFDLASPSPLEATASFDLPSPTIPQLDHHYVYSLKDFQPFESNTYEGMYTEVKKWVDPLVSNKALHSEFIKYASPPRTLEKLQTIEKFLMEYGNALRASEPLPTNSQASLDPVLAALSPEWAVKLDEVSSIIIVAEALDEFPQHIVKKALQLSDEKRSTLVNFIRKTPFGVDKHVCSNIGPFMDPDVNPLMTRMGYSMPAYSQQLEVDMGFEENQDRLAAGLILLLGTDTK